MVQDWCRLGLVLCPSAANTWFFLQAVNGSSVLLFVQGVQEWLPARCVNVKQQTWIPSKTCSASPADFNFHGEEMLILDKQHCLIYMLFIPERGALNMFLKRSF